MRLPMYMAVGAYCSAAYPEKAFQCRCSIRETWLWDFGDTIDLILDEYVWIGDDRPPVDRMVELH